MVYQTVYRILSGIRYLLFYMSQAYLFHDMTFVALLKNILYNNPAWISSVRLFAVSYPPATKADILLYPLNPAKWNILALSAYWELFST